MPRPRASHPPPRPLEAVIAALNGVIGDHLHRSGNGLATEPVLLHRGVPLRLERDALRRILPDAGGRIAVWIHGLCVDERCWSAVAGAGASYPELLARDLRYAPLLLRYNSGRHVSENGEILADRLEALVEAFPAPVEELLLVGFSMGGLVARSACHVAAERGDRWLRAVKQAIYLGVPHLGTPVERLGRVVAWTLRTAPTPITRLIAQVGDLRSAGIQDLGHGRILREHWEGADPTAALHEPHHPLPLLATIRHGLIAGRLRPGERDLLSALFGDGMVPLASASLGRHRAAGTGGERIRIVPGVGHLGLVRHPEVWAQLRAWCAEEAA